MSDIQIRPYARGDRDGFLALYQSVFGSERSDDWFRWKYEENPHVTHVPILVAVDDGHIVGARSFFALEVACCETPQVVLQPCDAMVHPEYRRQGIFTRMTERAIARYRDEHPFFFNFPNEQSLPGNLELGWEVVARRAPSLRLENPSRLLSDRTSSQPLQWTSNAFTPLAQRYYQWKDRQTPRSTLTVQKQHSPPVDTLTTLYERNVPDEIHAVRSAQSYEWRLDNPDYDYTAYVATESGKPIAAAVTGQSARSNSRTLRILDIVPLVSAPKPAQRALLRRIFEDVEAAALVSAPPQGFADEVLRAFSFYRADSLPLSYLTKQMTHVVRPLTGEGPQPSLDVTDDENWVLTFFVYDVF